MDGVDRATQEAKAERNWTDFSPPVRVRARDAANQIPLTYAPLPDIA